MEQGGLGKGLGALISDEVKKDFFSEHRLRSLAEDKKEDSGENGKEGLEFKEAKEELAEPAFALQWQSTADGLQIVELAIADVIPNINQPRKNFDDEKLEELAQSIKEHGLIQPIVVTRRSDGKYEIVAGERRYRSSLLAGLEKIPAIIKEIDDMQKMELSIIENVQRENLNPIEEALAYQSLIQDFALTQEKVAAKVNKARSTVANLLRLLRLPLAIQEALQDGRITEGHAKLLSSIEDEKKQREVFKRILKYNWSVKDMEEGMQGEEGQKDWFRKGTKQNPLIAQKEKNLSDYLGLKAKIRPGKKGGKIIIEYYTDDDLDRINEILRDKELD